MKGIETVLFPLKNMNYSKNSGHTNAFHIAMIHGLSLRVTRRVSKKEVFHFVQNDMLYQNQRDIYHFLMKFCVIRKKKPRFFTNGVSDADITIEKPDAA